MWLIAMFDLPVGTKDARREYSRFRDALVGQGFSRLQFSVYARYFPSEEAAHAKRRLLATALPPDGQVRFLTITDCQFGKTEVFHGKRRAPVERPPEQLMLF